MNIIKRLNEEDLLMFGPNRYICDVLHEMRKMLETLDYSTLGAAQFRSAMSLLATLIEEAQTMVNRMESALSDHGDYKRMLKQKDKLKKEIKELKEEKSKLKDSDDEA